RSVRRSLASFFVTSRRRPRWVSSTSLRATSLVPSVPALPRRPRSYMAGISSWDMSKSLRSPSSQSRPVKEGLLDCPSAQPGMTDARVLGVVSGEADAPRLAYLNERVPATPELLAEAAPAEPGEVFRLAARCEQSRCTHFDGGRCQLAARIVESLAVVSD